MKKPDAFDRKRKVRDKASKRLLKSRDIIPWSVLMFMLMGGVVVGLSAQVLGQEPFLWMLIGCNLGSIVSPWYIVWALNR